MVFILKWGFFLHDNSLCIKVQLNEKKRQVRWMVKDDERINLDVENRIPGCFCEFLVQICIYRCCNPCIATKCKWILWAYTESQNHAYIGRSKLYCTHSHARIHRYTVTHIRALFHSSSYKALFSNRQPPKMIRTFNEIQMLS